MIFTIMSILYLMVTYLIYCETDNLIDINFRLVTHVTVTVNN